MSIGAITQTINFNSNELTLILGENLDLGGGASRNGVGKTAGLQSLSYALFGVPINNIRKDNLINRTNGKNMMVTLEFEVNSISYKIERGRRPNILRFYVNSNLQETKDDAQGESKETQRQIEHILGMSSDMFKHIVALNTYTEPFLSMKSLDQRNIIEQLLGITLLSEKAEMVKEKFRINKDQIQQEEFNIKAIEEANKRVQEQIDALKRRQRLWKANHDEVLNNLVSSYEQLNSIDFAAEFKAHGALDLYKEQLQRNEERKSTVYLQSSWKEDHATKVNDLKSKLEQLSKINIVVELQSHKDLLIYNEKYSELQNINSRISQLELQLTKDITLVEKLEKEVDTLKENKCYACDQDFHDEKHVSVLNNKISLLESANITLVQTQNDLEKNKNSVFELHEIPNTYYSTETEAIRHSSELDNLQKLIDQKELEVDPYKHQLSNYPEFVLGDRPTTIYATITELIEQQSNLSNLEKNIETKIAEVDPYAEQLVEMEANALQEIRFDKINQLSKYGDHLKFLQDLLTSKDSFIRKKIIDQSLSFLNTRLSDYLEKIGLPHTVIFKNDLSVEITEFGRELDFHNLSRGEMNRVILALSWAFRDVWENLYSPINVMFIDELLDNGTDSIGVEASLGVLKDLNRHRNKSIWLISHKDELTARVSSVLRVVKENGYTTYSTDVENV